MAVLVVEHLFGRGKLVAGDHRIIEDPPLTAQRLNCGMETGQGSLSEDLERRVIEDIMPQGGELLLPAVPDRVLRVTPQYEEGPGARPKNPGQLVEEEPEILHQMQDFMTGGEVHAGGGKRRPLRGIEDLNGGGLSLQSEQGSLARRSKGFQPDQLRRFEVVSEQCQEAAAMRADVQKAMDVVGGHFCSEMS